MTRTAMLIAVALAGTTFASAAMAKETYVDPAPTEKLDPKDPNYMRCRKIQVTGSLVKKERLCKTNAEWAKSRDQQQRDAGEFIERSRAGMNPNG